MICSRCGIETPRLKLGQTRCPTCQGEVDRLIEGDTRRRTRFARAKELTPVGAL